MHRLKDRREWVENRNRYERTLKYVRQLGQESMRQWRERREWVEKRMVSTPFEYLGTGTGYPVVSDDMPMRECDGGKSVRMGIQG
jgi:hypothetical protein